MDDNHLQVYKPSISTRALAETNSRLDRVHLRDRDSNGFHLDQVDQEVSIKADQVLADKTVAHPDPGKTLDSSLLSNHAELQAILLDRAPFTVVLHQAKAVQGSDPSVKTPTHSNKVAEVDHQQTIWALGDPDPDPDEDSQLAHSKVDPVVLNKVDRELSRNLHQRNLHPQQEQDPKHLKRWVSPHNRRMANV